MKSGSKRPGRGIEDACFVGEFFRSWGAGISLVLFILKIGLPLGDFVNTMGTTGLTIKRRGT